MAKIRFIGSKTRISKEILHIIGEPSGRNSRFVDAMCGSGAVAIEAAKRGWPIVINDFLKSSVIMAEARILSKEQVPFENLGGYPNVVSELNELEGVEGFFYKEYCKTSKPPRPYFTDENAKKIDAMRNKIRQWCAKDSISDKEKSLLIGDLMMAVNQVANTAGTYGCFMKKMQKNALKPINMEVRDLPSKSHHQLEKYQVDVSQLHHHIGPEDIVYLDPPYTKRQYAAYYHILETIAEDSEPTVSGKTGLRDWSNQKSAFCYKRKALDSIVEVIESLLVAKRIYLSYSDSSHVSINDLERALCGIDGVKVKRHDMGEITNYTPSQKASENRDHVTEWLFEVLR